jgi:hypothetical protein
MNSKVVVPVLVGLLIVGCSSTPTYKLKGYQGPEALSRNEVVMASKECIRARLKPNVEYVTQRTDGGKVLVPINVHCEPY